METISGIKLASMNPQQQQPIVVVTNVQAYVDEVIPPENVQILSTTSTSKNTTTNPGSTTTTSQQHRRRKRTLLALVLLLMIVGCAIVVSLLLLSTRRRSSSSSTSIGTSSPISFATTSSLPTTTQSASSPSSQPPSSSPTATTPTPTTSQWGRLSYQLRDIVPTLTVDIISDPSSYQYQALHWLANEDEYLLSQWEDNPPNVLVTRYALACIYFAGKDYSTSRWLTNTSHCNWFYITCDENETIVQISNRKFQNVAPILFLYQKEEKNDWSVLPETKGLFFWFGRTPRRTLAPISLAKNLFCTNPKTFHPSLPKKTNK